MSYLDDFPKQPKTMGEYCTIYMTCDILQYIYEMEQDADEAERQFKEEVSKLSEIISRAKFLAFVSIALSIIVSALRILYEATDPLWIWILGGLWLIPIVLFLIICFSNQTEANLVRKQNELAAHSRSKILESRKYFDESELLQDTCKILGVSHLEITPSMCTLLKAAIKGQIIIRREYHEF